MTPLLSVKDFSKSYGSVRAVQNLDFEVEKGELFGLIGPDGAGKTTTMRCIVTLLRPDSGRITVEGKDAVHESKAIRAITGYMPQRFSLYTDLSVGQNLRFFADLFAVPREEIPVRMERLYRFSRLEPFADRLAGRLSGGMKQKLALSCTLIHNPVLLVLDEPTTGVDPVSRKEFWDILQELRDQGVTILVSTPYMDEAMKCDRIVIMHDGRTLAQGTPDALINSMQYPIYALYDQRLVKDYEQLALAPGVRSVQTFGDSLHVTTEAEVTADDLTREIQSRFDVKSEAKRIDASLEDVFISLIEEGAEHVD
ncbi:ABC transporter ATP-binding protein [bacterium]|nr:ABC transporter ATP-binding protein [bacterium]